MSELLAHEGRCRRICPVCGTEIDVARPPRPMGLDATKSQRQQYASEIRRQILWQATCEGPDGCRSYWNRLLQEIEAEHAVPRR
jgi:hypothetical protein